MPCYKPHPQGTNRSSKLQNLPGVRIRMSKPCHFPISPALRRHSKSDCPVLESGFLPCSWGMWGWGGWGGGRVSGYKRLVHYWIQNLHTTGNIFLESFPGTVWLENPSQHVSCYNGDININSNKHSFYLFPSSNLIEN